MHVRAIHRLCAVRFLSRRANRPARAGQPFQRQTWFRNLQKSDKSTASLRKSEEFSEIPLFKEPTCLQGYNTYTRKQELVEFFRLLEGRAGILGRIPAQKFWQKSGRVIVEFKELEARLSTLNSGGKNRGF